MKEAFEDDFSKMTEYKTKVSPKESKEKKNI